MNLKRICDAVNSSKRIRPKTSEELKDLIEATINEQGPKCDLNFIDTSLIDNMSTIFERSKFNGDISQWDVSNVTHMREMFRESKFNGDISNWDVSNVTDMYEMFADSKFNGDISNWDVSNVTNMSYMFEGSKFNGDISNWDVSHATRMAGMFWKSKFNGDVSNWDVSNVTDMWRMFADSKFTGDVSSWNINEQCHTDEMFGEEPDDDITAAIEKKNQDKAAKAPAWVKRFIKASKGMPYTVGYDDYYAEGGYVKGGYVEVTVTGYIEERKSYPTEWMRKAAEADAEAEELIENRWNPSWDVAREALYAVCKKLNLSVTEKDGSPSLDLYIVTPKA